MLNEFASDLRISREKAKISLSEVSAQTRISEGFLTKIESGDFSFQQEIYVKAFIKEYSKAIGLDPAEVIKDYESAKRGDYKSKNLAEDKSEAGGEVIEPIEKDLSEKKGKGDNKSDKKKETTSKKDSKPVEDTTGIKDESETEPEVKSDKPPKQEKEIYSVKKKVSEKQDKAFIPPEEKKPSRKENLNLPPAKEKEGKYSFRESGDKVQPSVLRTVGIVFLVCLLLVGLYFMGKALFFEGNGEDGPEIIRQKFDDVVQENEKKILGKRTEQEIQDSIRLAEEEARLLAEQNRDTMTLEINSIRSGSITVIEDSLDINNPERISFTANQYGTWKATRNFLITSPNTSAFTVELNGKKIDIKGKSVKNYLITRKDLEGTDSTNTANQ